MPVPSSTLGQLVSTAATGGMNQAFGALGNSVGAGLGDAIFGGISARRNWKYKQKEMALQQQYALEQMEKQYGFMLDNSKAMFDYENAYNDPSKVFERFRLAGVNPAAVLGSSGASVGATVSSGNSGSAGVSLPHSSGSGGFTGMSGAVGDPVSQMLMNSQRKVLDSQAEKNEADAAEARGNTHSEDYRKAYDSYQLQIQQYNVKSADEKSKYDAAAARMAQNDAELSDTLFGYNLDARVAEVSEMKERADYWRKENDTFYRTFAANLAMTEASILLAKAEESLVSGEAALTREHLLDFQNYMREHWDREFEVPIYDEKGRIMEKKKLTGGQAVEIMNSFYASQASIGVGTAKWNLRSQKNALGYALLQATVHGAFGLAGSAVTRGGIVKGAQIRANSRRGATEEYRENYNSKGDYIGGTMVRRRDL